jgi:hypothetical protein
MTNDEIVFLFFKLKGGKSINKKRKSNNSLNAGN